MVHNTVAHRQFYLGLCSPSSRPTSHLRCSQVEVREDAEDEEAFIYCTDEYSSNV